jgi:hypothetical protein
MTAGALQGNRERTSSEPQPAFAPGYHFVRFSGPFGAADARWLDERTGPVRRADGTPLARAWFGDDTLCVWVEDGATLRELRAHGSIAAVGRFGPHAKLDARLADTQRGAELLLELDLVPGHAPERVLAELAACGGEEREQLSYRGERGHDLVLLVISAPRRALPALARIEGVRRIAPRDADALGGGELAELARAVAGAAELELCAHVSGEYDARAALIDLLAHERPALALVTASGAEHPSGLGPKNVGRTPRGAAHGHAVSCSSALARALALQDELAPAGAGEPSFRRDVAAHEGFAAADAPGHTYRFRAHAGEPFVLTLAWTDEPGAIGSEPALVNDLDLVVTTPSGEVFRRRLETRREGLLGNASEPGLAAEHFLAPALLGGTWQVVVEPVRGRFASPQGYALVARGLEPLSAPLALEIPATVTLRPNAGLHAKDGSLQTSALALLATSDDQRYVLRDRETVTFSFEALVPPGATLQALRVLVEHHELPRVDAGDIRWRLGHGQSSAPTIVASTSAPLRSGPGAETLDLWAPGVLVPNANDLELVIENGNQDDDTLIDRVAIEVDYLVSDSTPVITSVPSTTATVGQAYQYDADGRAQATSASAVSWSLVSGPSGFSIVSTTGQVSFTPAAAGSFAVTLRATNASGFSEQGYTLVVGSQPQLPATLLPANGAALVYLPSERLALGTAKSQQRLNVFLPLGTAPAGGWPVVLNNRAGGGLAALPLGSLQNTGATAPLHAFVASGIAVVDFGVTGIGNGLGLFYPPGHASGRYESFRPGDDNPEKDAEWAVQWLKTQATFPLSKSAICMRGSSQGAILALWCAMGPERARASGSAQVRASTKVRGVLALQPPTSNWAFDQDPTFTSNMIRHYEQAAAPGVAASFFRQVAESLQKAGSVMGFGFESAAARTWNQTQAVCLLYAEPVLRDGSAPADLTLDAAGYPRLTDRLTQTFVHDSWSGYVFFRRLLDLSASAGTFHRANSVFAVRDTSALPAPWNWHTQTYSGLTTGAAANALAHQWVLRTLTTP